MDRRIFTPKLFLASFLTAGLILVNAVFTCRNIETLYSNNNLVVHTHRVIEVIENISYLVAAEEARQRGYIITNDRQYLQHYDTALPLIDQELNALLVLVKDNSSQVTRALAFKETIRQRLQAMNADFDLMEKKGGKFSHEGMDTGIGHNQIGQLNLQAEEMIGAENQLLETRTLKSGRMYYATLWTVLLSNLVALAMIAAFLFVLRLYLISRDKDEKALFEEQERFRVTINSIGDGVLTTDTEGRIVFLNEVAQSLMGWTAQEARGKLMDKVFPIINEHTRLPVENPIWEALEKNTIVRMANHSLLISKNGREIPIEDSAAPIRDRDGAVIGVVLIFRDVTEDKKREQGQRHLAAIVDFSSDAIISKDLNSIITSWNKAAERLFGYTAQEAVGKSILMLIPPDRHHEETEIIGKIAAGEHIDHFETIRRRKDGSLVHISLSISPIKNQQGEVIGASKIARDITREYELRESLQESEAGFRQLSEELSRSNKELEQFAYVASHDLKEPLNTIGSLGDLILRRVGDKLGQKEKEYLEAIKQAALQGKNLVKNLLELSRIGQVQTPEKVNLQETLGKIKVNLNTLIKEHEARIECEGPLPMISGTSIEIGQVFQNLIENSIKYRRDQPPRIHISATPLENNRWLFAVRDNGIGINPAYKERIFDIFERLHSKSEHAGTGIGLAIVKKIVEHYGGKIWVESVPSQGSVFYFTLPGVP